MTANVLMQASVSVLQRLVKNGLTYEEAKNATMVICAGVVAVDGWDPELLCEPILDTYGPHVSSG